MQYIHNVRPYGTDSLMVSCDNAVIASVIRASRGLPGCVAAHGASGQVLVRFDRHVTEDDVCAVTSLSPSVVDVAETVPLTIPVRYDGPDLAVVAEYAGCSVREIINLHLSAIYVPEFFGFAPGFAYLGGTPTELHIPRRRSPRSVVEPGSVAIASGYSTVYPTSSPGGWHIIGHTDMVMFDPSATSPITILPNSSVTFTEVSR